MSDEHQFLVIPPATGAALIRLGDAVRSENGTHQSPTIAATAGSTLL